MVASSLSRKCIQCYQQYAACLKVPRRRNVRGIPKNVEKQVTHSNFQWIRLKSILSARTRQFRTAHLLCHAVAVDDGVALEESTPWFLFIRGGAPWFYHFGLLVRMSHLLYLWYLCLIWLVVWNIWIIFPYIGKCHHPN